MFFILFQYHADPCIRNLRAETPLDLACQYGRLESVEILLKKHPALLCDNVESHCPLHLASRNGHKQVVQVLIDSGFDLNTKVSEDLPFDANIYACVCVLLKFYSIDVKQVPDQIKLLGRKILPLVWLIW